MNIGTYTLEGYLNLVKSFHGYLAPGLIVGGFMVDLGMQNLPEGILFDAISETGSCLPDAIQLLTPCTIGNGWLKILPFGRYAASLYDKYTGAGVRVYLDAGKLDDWPNIKEWYLKLKPKKEQDSERLQEEILAAGASILTLETITVREDQLKKRSKGAIAICPTCHEAYPAKDGGICLACQGQSPYVRVNAKSRPALKLVPVEEGVGKPAVHDMTRIIPGTEKGPAFLRGQEITAGDVCRLQKMGRMHIYALDEEPDSEWVHEDEAALAFAQAMAGDGVRFSTPPREGKINFRAEQDGLFVVNTDMLNAFNRAPGVACASRQGYTLVKQGDMLGGERAIPLYLHRDDYMRALDALDGEPLFTVKPLRKATVGILITGSEVFQGLVQDGFGPIVRAKVEPFGCTVAHQIIVPDDRAAIAKGIADLIATGADLIVTTAGLSVDPDDVTRLGLEDAGATDMLYGAPIFPGAMTLLARIGAIPVIGVPACALFHKITGFDLILPRVLAGLTITREDLARMGHGAFCLECPVCTFPRCSFIR
ncbi:MAG TPA: FmdE family protein [Deltaproteobacteria bacterium]|nr:FmdE family protein [Deltaproteobacteria bacterium]